MEWFLIIGGVVIAVGIISEIAKKSDNISSENSSSLKPSIKFIIETHEFIEGALKNMPDKDKVKIFALFHLARQNLIKKNNLSLAYPERISEEQYQKLVQIINANVEREWEPLRKAQAKFGFEISENLDEFELYLLLDTLAHKFLSLIFGLSVIKTDEFRFELRKIYYLLSSTQVIPHLRSSIIELQNTAVKINNSSKINNLANDIKVNEWLSICQENPQWMHMDTAAFFESIEKQKD